MRSGLNCMIMFARSLQVLILLLVLCPNRFILPGWNFFSNAETIFKFATQEIRNLSHRLAAGFFNNSTLEKAVEVLLNNMNVEKKYNISLYFDKAVDNVKISRELQQAHRGSQQHILI